MNSLELLILALGGSRFTRLVVHDSITESLRTWLWYRYPASDTQFGDSEVHASGKVVDPNQPPHSRTISDYTAKPSGVIGLLNTGVEVFRDVDAWYALRPRFIGNVVSCHWCFGLWVGIIAAAGYWLYPDLTWFALPFALSEVTGLLNDH